MEYTRSMRSASAASFSLRANVFSRVRKLCLASCCVMVLPPSARFASRRFGPCRAGNPEQVHAAVFVEALIFDRQNRLPQVRGHPGQRHVDAVFLEDGEHRAIVDVVERRGLRHIAHGPERVAAGHAREECPEANTCRNPDTCAADGYGATVPVKPAFRVFPQRSPINIDLASLNWTHSGGE